MLKLLAGAVGAVILASSVAAPIPEGPGLHVDAFRTVAEKSSAPGPAVPHGAYPDGTVIAWGPASGKNDWLVASVPGSSLAQQRGWVGGAEDAALIAMCSRAGSSAAVVEAMGSKYDGTVRLLCGSATVGLNHILKNHPLSQWRGQMGGDGSVTAWIRYLIRNSLAAPAKKAPLVSNKRCYSTPVHVYRMVNGRPSWWKTINPSVYVSSNNKIVVTAIPTTSSRC